MDKASIVGDAIDYVRELQKQLKSVQDGILALQSAKYPSHVAQYSRRCKNEVVDAQQQYIQVDIQQHGILEMHVSNMESETPHLRVHCKRQDGVLVQLTKALEALKLDIVSANLTTVGDHVLSTIVFKADEVLALDDFKEMLMKTLSMHGLHF